MKLIMTEKEGVRVNEETINKNNQIQGVLAFEHACKTISNCLQQYL